MKRSADPRYRALCRSQRRCYPPAPASSGLDYGCGPGPALAARCARPATKWRFTIPSCMKARSPAATISSPAPKPRTLSPPRRRVRPPRRAAASRRLARPDDELPSRRRKICRLALPQGPDARRLLQRTDTPHGRSRARLVLRISRSRHSTDAKDPGAADLAQTARPPALSAIGVTKILSMRRSSMSTTS